MKKITLSVDSLSILNELTTDQKAELIQAIYDFHIGKELKLTGLMKSIFVSFENEFTKKQKTKKEFIPPTIEEVISYFSENQYSVEAAKTAYNYYNIANWTDSQGSPVRNWKQKMIANWFTPKNKVSATTYSPSKPTGFQFM